VLHDSLAGISTHQDDRRPASDSEAPLLLSRVSGFCQKDVLDINVAEILQMDTAQISPCISPLFPSILTVPHKICEEKGVG
jgi:hypothetical protein